MSRDNLESRLKREGQLDYQPTPQERFRVKVSYIKVELCFGDKRLDLNVDVDDRIMREALAPIDSSNTGFLGTPQSVSVPRWELRHQIAKAATNAMLELLSKNDTVEGYKK